MDEYSLCKRFSPIHLVVWPDAALCPIFLSLSLSLRSRAIVLHWVLAIYLAPVSPLKSFQMFIRRAPDTLNAVAQACHTCPLSIIG